MTEDRRRHAVALATTGAVFLVLSLLLLAIERQSLVGDGPYHLLAGDQALREGQNRLNLEHPPLVKLIAAVPLLADSPLGTGVTVADVGTAKLRLFEDPARARRARRRSRSMLLAVFALPFLVGCYFLGRDWEGPRTGLVLTLCVGLSVAVLPYLVIVQTDAAVALGFVLTVLAAIRYQGNPRARTAIALGAAFGLALASKYSGIFLGPTVLAAVCMGSTNAPRESRARRLGMQATHLVLLTAVACSIVWVTYAVANRRYRADAGRDTIERYLDGEGMITGQSLREYEDLLLATEKLDHNIGQWLTGLLAIRAQDRIGVYPSFAFGTVTSEGRWWYFPAVLAVTTPVALLFSLVFAAVDWSIHRRRWNRLHRNSAALIGLTTAVYLAAAATSNYNLGPRHLLPIVPFIYLPAAAWAARRQRREILLVSVLALEAIALSPVWMSATNTWWLGRLNPTRLALGSSEYRQNFLALEKAREDRGLDSLDVVYPLLSAAELKAYVPRSRLVDPNQGPDGEWVAVNILVEQFLPALSRADPDTLRGYEALSRLAKEWTPVWETVRNGEDHGYVAGTFHLFRLAPSGGED